MTNLNYLLAEALRLYYPNINASDIERIDRSKEDPLEVDIHIAGGHIFPRFDIRTLRDFIHEDYRFEFDDEDLDLANVKMRFFTLDGIRVPVEDFYMALPALPESGLNLLLEEGSFETDEHVFETGLIDFDKNLL